MKMFSPYICNISICSFRSKSPLLRFNTYQLTKYLGLQLGVHCNISVYRINTFWFPKNNGQNLPNCISWVLHVLDDFEFLLVIVMEFQICFKFIMLMMHQGTTKE